MKKTMLFFALAFAILLAILPIPLERDEGAYNTFSRLIWCEYENVCYHEVAHRLDQEGGWVSHSREFSLTVSAFVWFELDADHKQHQFVYKIMTFPGVFRNTPSFFTDDNAELYASLFEWAEGKEENMPELLRPYYDWERAAELIEKVMR